MQYPLTKQAAKVKAAYQALMKDGVCPSQDEVAEYCGFEGYARRSRVCLLLDQLEDRGHIKRKKGKHRAIVIIGEKK